MRAVLHDPGNYKTKQIICNTCWGRYCNKVCEQVIFISILCKCKIFCEAREENSLECKTNNNNCKKEPEKRWGKFADKPARDKVARGVLEADQDDREFIAK